MNTGRNISATPSLTSIASFFVRSRCLQIQRGVQDGIARQPRLGEASPAEFPFVASESISPLWTDTDTRERPLLEGKVANLRVACAHIHGRRLAAHESFSFWRQVGPPRRSRGFVLGREVRGGCVIPTVGGGLCQLSGSLLEAALRAGCEVTEQHRHSALPSDIAYRPERDATVFWNYIDLRFRATQPLWIEAVLTANELIVRLRAEQARLTTPVFPVALQTETPAATTLAASCYSCGKTSCIRHPKS